MNQRELFLRHVAQTSDTPMLGVDVDIVSARGCILTDRKGKKYIDLISGISVSNVGHCHPKVVKAVQEQAAKYMHLMVYGEFNQEPQVKYADTLCKLLPQSLDSVYFTTGGSEAVEAAIKLAKRASGRREIVSFVNGYHGSSQGALSLMGNESLKNSFRPLIPGGRILEFNKTEQLKFITRETAAVIIEPIQGEAGVRIADQKYIKALRAKCDSVGALLIFDEIQTGFGRCGSLFAFQNYEVIPDMLLIAKGMGGGLPIGAFIASRKLMSELSHDPALGHINTFGGNAVCVAAAQACLEVITENNLAERALEIERFAKMRLKHKKIRELRIRGALGAIEFQDEALCMRVIKSCLAQGIISDWFLFCPTAMRFAPPLVISNTQLEEVLEKLSGILDTL